MILKKFIGLSHSLSSNGFRLVANLILPILLISCLLKLGQKLSVLGQVFYWLWWFTWKCLIDNSLIQYVFQRTIFSRFGYRGLLPIFCLLCLHSKPFFLILQHKIKKYFQIGFSRTYACIWERNLLHRCQAKMLYTH